MNKQQVKINRIPAIIWGEPSDILILAIHGNQSSKTDVPIEILAQEATSLGFQVLSFDLPEHGERKSAPEQCNPQTCKRDLQAILAFATQDYKEISLFACSMGAYFSLLTYADEAFQQCLFLSPVVEMLHIIQNMMHWAQVSEEKLKQEREIPTAFGPTLYWDYYQTVKASPITRWNQPTSILYGERDELCAKEDVTSFAERFHCNLQIVGNAEHYFHTEEELSVYRDCLKRHLSA
jgi:pimeloyl-ACP methyl ester carboxylesterase